MEQAEVRIPQRGGAMVVGDVVRPAAAEGLVVFAHGSGSSRHSGRNRQVAAGLNGQGLATLLMDLLTPEEERVDVRTAELRLDIPLLAERLVGALDWLAEQDWSRDLRVGFFGASTGGGAALVAAAQRPDAVGAVVSRGGRPDLAGAALSRVRAPTLLVVGGADDVVLGLNRQALRELRCEARLEVVPGATHLFEEPGALDRVTDLAGSWFASHLGAPGHGPVGSR